MKFGDADTYLGSVVQTQRSWAALEKDHLRSPGHPDLLWGKGESLGSYGEG